MKNFIQKNKRYIVLSFGIFVGLLVILVLIVFLRNHSVKDDKVIRNKYNFSDTTIEASGTEYYTNDNLQMERCVDNICISKISFFYLEKSGRVDYTIVNRSKKEATGGLKLLFGDRKIIALYKDLKPGKSMKSSMEYVGMEIKNKEDYSLEKMSEKELKKVNLSK